MSIKNTLKKVVVAVALTLAVTFSTGAWEDMTGMSAAQSVQAGCLGGGSGSGSGSGAGGGC